MSLSANPEPELLDTTGWLAGKLPETSVFRLLHERGGLLFPGSMFADLFESVGRDCVPVRVIATVMVLQKLLGASDRDAVDRLAFDVRWRFACGLPAQGDAFHATVLVGMRARLAKSKRPSRIFDAVLDLAKSANLIGRRRVVDSTAIYDAVATMDTVTMVRNGLCGVFRELADPADLVTFRAVVLRDDMYAVPGKPSCADWDSAKERATLVDALARDGHAVTAAADGRTWPVEVKAALRLLATLLGQDIVQAEDGRFEIRRGVAPDRIISTVDPEARHGHKTSSKGFDGYKGHIAIDPDVELITAVAVTPGNAKDSGVTETILADVLPVTAAALVPAATPSLDAVNRDADVVSESSAAPSSPPSPTDQPVEVYGDAGYAAADLLDRLNEAGVDAYIHVPAAGSKNGCFSKADFEIDLAGRTVRCPQKITVPIQTRPSGQVADFGAHCTGCPLRDACTQAKHGGRHITIHAREAALSRGRERHAEAGRKKRYNETRPKVERKFGHLMRPRHGGRRGRVIGLQKVFRDFEMLAAAINLARIAVLAANPASSLRVA